MSFDITPVISLRQSLVAARVSLESQQPVMTLFPECRDEFLGYDQSVFSHFYQLFTVSWEA